MSAIGPNAPLPIGPLTGAGSPSPATARTDAPFTATLAAATAAVSGGHVDVHVPPKPPEAVRDAIGIAADRVDLMAQAGRELHFDQDEATGRVIIQVRDTTTGHVVRTIPPSGALAMLSPDEG
jgi:hypothetical protein